MLIRNSILWLVLTLSLTPTSNAADCTPLISACRDAIAIHKKAELDANDALNKQIDLTAKVIDQRDSAEAGLRRWDHNPFYMSAIGFAIGVLVVGYAFKH